MLCLCWHEKARQRWVQRYDRPCFPIETSDLPASTNETHRPINKKFSTSSALIRSSNVPEIVRTCRLREIRADVTFPHVQHFTMLLSNGPLHARPTDRFACMTAQTMKFDAASSSWENRYTIVRTRWNTAYARLFRVYWRPFGQRITVSVVSQTILFERT